MASYLYGVHPSQEAFASGIAIEQVFLADSLEPRRASEFEQLARARGLRVERVGRDRLDKMATGGVHQGVVLRVGEFAYVDIEDVAEAATRAGPKGLVLVLDGLEDPHNLGALVRSAHGFGCQGVVIPKDRAAQVTPAVIKASAGALAHVPVARVTNLVRSIERLKEAGLWVVGADLSGDKFPDEVDLKGPTALVLGNEGQGLRRLTLEQCDFRVRIPMVSGLESLNASVAGGILLYEIVRQRR